MPGGEATTTRWRHPRPKRVPIREWRTRRDASVRDPAKSAAEGAKILRPSAESYAGSPRFDAASLHSREDDAKHGMMRPVQIESYHTAGFMDMIEICL
jgi:hypothetical protein